MNRRQSSPASSQFSTNHKVIPLYPTQKESPTSPSTTKVWRYLFVSLFICVCIGATYHVWGTYRQLEATKEELVEAKAYHAQAVDYNKLVQHEYRRVQSSNYLAEVARRDYYYSKPDEIIFDLEDYEAVDNIFKSQTETFEHN